MQTTRACEVVIDATNSIVELINCTGYEPLPSLLAASRLTSVAEEASTSDAVIWALVGHAFGWVWRAFIFYLVPELIWLTLCVFMGLGLEDRLHGAADPYRSNNASQGNQSVGCSVVHFVPACLHLIWLVLAEMGWLGTTLQNASFSMRGLVSVFALLPVTALLGLGVAGMIKAIRRLKKHRQGKQEERVLSDCERQQGQQTDPPAYDYELPVASFPRDEPADSVTTGEALAASRPEQAGDDQVFSVGRAS